MGRIRRLVPVCEDSIGTTWLGAITHGEDAGRQVLVTVVNQSPDSLVAAPLLGAARRELTLRHSSVLAFLDVEMLPEKFLLVSEAMEGEPLSTLMGAAAQRGEPIPPGVALRIIKDAASALTALRRVRPGVLSHGLLNPETIFVASCGEVVLRQPELRSAALTIAGFSRNSSTLSYQAPEVLLDGRENEECGDVFSAGVLLWEMMAGRGLFGAREQFKLGRTKALVAAEAEMLKQRILHEEIPSLAQVEVRGGAISPDVVRLVDWAVTRDTFARPQSLDAFCGALDSLPAGAVASGAEVGQYLRRLLSDTFDSRQQLVAEALMPSRPVPMPVHFAEPNTTPRALAMSSRRPALDLEPDEEPAPVAVLPIASARKRQPREGWWAAAAGVLLAGGLGSYLLVEQAQTRQSSAAQDALIDESKQRLIEAPAEPREGRPTEGATDHQVDVGSEVKPQQEKAKEPKQARPSAPRTSPVKPPQPGAAHKTGYRPSGI